jgi:hypothetical protein
MVPLINDSGPIDGAILEQARSFANEAMSAVALPRRRIRSSESEEEAFVSRIWTDLQRRGHVTEGRDHEGCIEEREVIDGRRHRHRGGAQARRKGPRR